MEGLNGNRTVLTPYNRDPLDKLIASQLLKFPTLYGTLKFITAFTRALQLSL